MAKADFSKKLVRWYDEHHRDLPWRNTLDPYKIWLSEIILQQTRVAQGLPYFQKFIQHYPTIRSLAKAKEKEVLRLWQGLGYYTRARNLHQCAKEVVKKFNGEFPNTFEKLKQLPGIGDYTAAAIASFAFNEPVAVVDGNVYRVLSRVFGIDKDIASPEGKKFFSALANQLIPKDNPATHNQAMMEFGAIHCLPQNPKCESCVFKTMCVAYRGDLQSVLPVKIRRLKVTYRYIYYFIFRKGPKILMKERSEKGIWRGLYDFPAVEEKKAVRVEKILGRIFPFRKKSLPTSDGYLISEDYKHVLTHQVIHARFIEVEWPAEKILPSVFSSAELRWYSTHQIHQMPKPVLISRYLADRSIL